MAVNTYWHFLGSRFSWALIEWEMIGITGIPSFLHLITIMQPGHVCVDEIISKISCTNIELSLHVEEKCIKMVIFLLTFLSDISKLSKFVIFCEVIDT